MLSSWILPWLAIHLAWAEDWPPLGGYVRSTSLIVLAVAHARGDRWTFEVESSWRGTFDPEHFAHTTPEGRFFARQGEHGVHVVEGQQIVFFFGPRDPPGSGRHARHSTAFPVRGGQVRYAETGGPGEPTIYPLEDFEAAIRSVE